MFKKFIKLTGIVLLIGFISIFVRGIEYHETKSTKYEDKVVLIPPEEKQSIIDGEVVNSLLYNDDNKNEEVSKTQEQNLDVPTETKNEVKSKETTSQSKKEVPTSKPKSEEIPQENIEKIETSASTPKVDVVEETKKQEIWEILGMSEDQYYNQPLYSWERVDFKTYDECTSYGDKYLQSINGETNYVCRDITSMSGKYLGVMFDTEKTN